MVPDGPTMKAALCKQYGPPEILQIEQVPRPTPSRDEVLVKIHASTVNSSDWFIRSELANGPIATRMMMRLLIGLRRPRKEIIGLILAGEVVETGERVERFRPGDRVYAFTKFHLGSYAQYTCLPERATIGHAPANLGFEEIAAIPYGGLLALHYLREAGLRPGQRALIYGASGAVGTSAVQLARHFGAATTGVCGPSNLDLVKSLGADTVIDYTSRNSVDVEYDVVFDAVGKRKSSPLKVAAKQSLTPDGTYTSVDDGTPKLPPGDLDILKDPEGGASGGDAGSGDDELYDEAARQSDTGAPCLSQATLEYLERL